MSHMIDFAAIQRPAKPNTYLLAPEGVCGDAETDADAPVFEVGPDQLFESIGKLLASQNDVIDLKANPQARQFAYVSVTKLLRFKDDVNVQVLPIDGNAHRSTLAVYSRSRVGYSDLGKNRKRVEALLQALPSLV